MHCSRVGVLEDETVDVIIRMDFFLASSKWSPKSTWARYAITSFEILLDWVPEACSANKPKENWSSCWPAKISSHYFTHRIQPCHASKTRVFCLSVQQALYQISAKARHDSFDAACRIFSPPDVWKFVDEIAEFALPNILSAVTVDRPMIFFYTNYSLLWFVEFENFGLAKKIPSNPDLRKDEG